MCLYAFEEGESMERKTQTLTVRIILTFVRQCKEKLRNRWTFVYQHNTTRQIPRILGKCAQNYCLFSLSKTFLYGPIMPSFMALPILDFSLGEDSSAPTRYIFSMVGHCFWGKSY